MSANIKPIDRIQAPLPKRVKSYHAVFCELMIRYVRESKGWLPSSIRIPYRMKNVFLFGVTAPAHRLDVVPFERETGGTNYLRGIPIEYPHVMVQMPDLADPETGPHTMSLDQFTQGTTAADTILRALLTERITNTIPPAERYVVPDATYYELVKQLGHSPATRPFEVSYYGLMVSRCESPTLTDQCILEL